MSAAEIIDAQHPVAGWRREARAFRPRWIGAVPRWPISTMPLDAIGRAPAQLRRRAAATGKASAASLRASARRSTRWGWAASRPHGLRRRYSDLVRKYTRTGMAGPQPREQIDPRGRSHQLLRKKPRLSPRSEHDPAVTSWRYQSSVLSGIGAARSRYLYRPRVHVPASLVSNRRRSDCGDRVRLLGESRAFPEQLVGFDHADQFVLVAAVPPFLSGWYLRTRSE